MFWTCSANWKKMRITDFQPILDILSAVPPQGRILIITHERPDGDAVGSTTALWYLLTENGYTADLFYPDELPDAYRTFVPENSMPSFPLKTAEDIAAHYAMVFSADASTPKRTGLGGIDPASVTIPFAAVDHHPDHIDFAPVVYVDHEAGSASEIVYLLARAARWKISAEAATRLLLGITTDTGCFRFDNTSPRAHRISADLLEAGADQHRVIDRAYFSKPFNLAQFEADLFCRFLRTALDGKFAWFLITNEILDKYGVNVRNLENLVENIRCIEGVEVAALLKPTNSPGIFKISLRSKNPAVSVGKIARRLNGGGHELAAGGTIFAKNAEAAEMILLKNVEMEINPK